MASDISLAKVMMKYQVRDFILDDFLSNVYIGFIAETYPNGIPDSILQNMRMALNEGNYDLRKLPAEIILKLFTIPDFEPDELKNYESRIIEDLYNLVTSGRDRGLK